MYVEVLKTRAISFFAVPFIITTDKKQISFSRLCQPTVNVLLYGVDNLSFNDNKQIFDAVHDFLIKTKRFQHNS